MIFNFRRLEDHGATQDLQEVRRRILVSFLKKLKNLSYEKSHKTVRTAGSNDNEMASGQRHALGRPDPH